MSSSLFNGLTFTQDYIKDKIARVNKIQTFEVSDHIDKHPNVTLGQLGLRSGELHNLRGDIHEDVWVSVDINEHTQFHEMCNEIVRKRNSIR